jgi:hypothetical protein
MVCDVRAGERRGDHHLYSGKYMKKLFFFFRSKLGIGRSYEIIPKQEVLPSMFKDIHIHGEIENFGELEPDEPGAWRGDVDLER